MENAWGIRARKDEVGRGRKGKNERENGKAAARRTTEKRVSLY